MHYKLSPRQIARCRCNDCGVNVIEAGDYCMPRPRIWRDTFGLGITDNLCLPASEGRTHGCTDQCCKREESSCQLGAVHTWPLADNFAATQQLGRFRSEADIEPVSVVQRTCSD